MIDTLNMNDEVDSSCDDYGMMAKNDRCDEYDMMAKNSRCHKYDEAMPYIWSMQKTIDAKYGRCHNDDEAMP